MPPRFKPTLYVILGVVFWFSGAMLVRFIGPHALTEGNPLRLAMFGLTLPLTLGLLASAKAAGGLQWHELLRPTVVMTFTATLLDGTALTWFRPLYADSYEVGQFGAALILWGGGVGLLLAYLLEQRKATAASPGPNR